MNEVLPSILGIALFTGALFFLVWFLVWLVTPGSEMEGYSLYD